MLGMGKLEKARKEVLDEASVLEFPAAVSKINSYIYEMLESQKNKSGKVTAEIMGTMKKCMDFIAICLVKAHRECVSSETKLKTLITHNTAYEALADKFSRSRPTSQLDVSRHAAVLSPKLTSESVFIVIVTSSGKDSSDTIKRNI